METYRRVISFLKRAIPPSHTVSVRRVKLSERLDGDCCFNGDKFVIRINRTLPEHEAIETALHEWGHVLAWELCPYEDHCDQWGKAYSRVYRLFLKEFIDKNN